jgi:hypothetical protein
MLMKLNPSTLRFKDLNMLTLVKFVYGGLVLGLSQLLIPPFMLLTHGQEAWYFSKYCNPAIWNVDVIGKPDVPG